MAEEHNRRLSVPPTTLVASSRPSLGIKAASFYSPQAWGPKDGLGLAAIKEKTLEKRVSHAFP